MLKSSRIFIAKTETVTENSENNFEHWGYGCGQSALLAVVPLAPPEKVKRRQWGSITERWWPRWCPPLSPFCRLRSPCFWRRTSITRTFCSPSGLCFVFKVISCSYETFCEVVCCRFRSFVDGKVFFFVIVHFGCVNCLLARFWFDEWICIIGARVEFFLLYFTRNLCIVMVYYRVLRVVCILMYRYIWWFLYIIIYWDTTWASVVK